MVRALLVLLSSLVSIGLFHFLGVWALLAMFGALFAVFALSTRKVDDAAAEPSIDRPTGFRTTSVAPF